MMRELFRDRDHTTVVYFRNLLESHGIATILRNEDLSTSGLTEIPLPEFYANICIIEDKEYNRARDIIQQVLDEQANASDEEITCLQCSETNPANFEICYNCQADIIPLSK